VEDKTIFQRTCNHSIVFRWRLSATWESACLLWQELSSSWDGRPWPQ